MLYPFKDNANASAQTRWAVAEASGWAAYLTALGRSPRTVASYARTAARFIEFLTHERQLTTWADVSRADVRAYLSAAYARGLTARSVNIEAAALRSFGRFLAWGGAVEGGAVAPLSVIPRANEPARLPTWLTRAEAVRLCAAPDVTTPTGLRDRAIIELLWATGLRLAEVVALNVAQFHAGRRVMTVWGNLANHIGGPIGIDVRPADLAQGRAYGPEVVAGALAAIEAAERRTAANGTDEGEPPEDA